MMGAVLIRKGAQWISRTQPRVCSSETGCLIATNLSSRDDGFWRSGVFVEQCISKVHQSLQNVCPCGLRGHYHDIERRQRRDRRAGCPNLSFDAQSTTGMGGSGRIITNLTPLWSLYDSTIMTEPPNRKAQPYSNHLRPLKYGPQTAIKYTEPTFFS